MRSRCRGDAAVERRIADSGAGLVLDDLGLFPDVAGPLDVGPPGPEGVLLGIDSCDDRDVAGGPAPDQPERDRVLARLGAVVPDNNATGRGAPLTNLGGRRLRSFGVRLDVRQVGDVGVVVP